MPAQTNQMPGDQTAPLSDVGVDPNAPITQTASDSKNTKSSSITMPAGIDPRLADLYNTAGLTPGGQGTGFADWQYWQDKMTQPGNDPNYFINRLQADLAGTGTDQPTGTPGEGAWSKSGQNQPQGPIGGGALMSLMGGGMNVMPGSSPAQLAQAASQVQPSQLGQTQSDLLNTLMSRISATPRV
jgi:hypothetical protein